MWNRRNAIDVLQLCATPNPNKNSTLRISQILTNNILNLWWVGFAHPSTRFFVVARSINSEKEKNKVDFDLGPIPSVVVLRWDHFGTTQEVVDAILSQSWLFCWNFFLILAISFAHVQYIAKNNDELVDTNKIDTYYEELKRYIFFLKKKQLLIWHLEQTVSSTMRQRLRSIGTFRTQTPFVVLWCIFLRQVF